MARKEDINRDLNDYLSSRTKYKYPKKSKVEESVPKGLSNNRIHIIKGELSWFDKVKSRLKSENEKDAEKNKKESEKTEQEDSGDVSPEEVQKVIESSNWNHSDEFNEEDENFDEKKKCFFCDILKEIGKIFSSKKDYEKIEVDNSEENSDSEDKKNLAGGFMDKKVKALIDSLIEINIDILSKFPPEELDKFRRSESYQKLKEDIKEYKELIK